MAFREMKVTEKTQELERRIIELESSIIESEFGPVIVGQNSCVIDAAKKSFSDYSKDLDDEFDEAERLWAFAENFQHNVHAIAKFHMQQFFNDKTMHCGGKIPNVILLIDKRISLVINYDISEGILRAYQAMGDLVADETLSETAEISSDVKLVLETLNLLARSGVPQQFAGGMLLLYLEFVEGIEIGT